MHTHSVSTFAATDSEYSVLQEGSEGSLSRWTNTPLTSDTFFFSTYEARYKRSPHKQTPEGGGNTSMEAMRSRKEDSKART